MVLCKESMQEAEHVIPTHQTIASNMGALEQEKAFDRIPQGILWRVLQEYGVPDSLLLAIRSPFS